MIPTRPAPARPAAVDRAAVSVDLPTPPLAAAIAMVFMSVTEREDRGLRVRAFGQFPVRSFEWRQPCFLTVSLRFRFRTRGKTLRRQVREMCSRSFHSSDMTLAGHLAALELEDAMNKNTKAIIAAGLLFSSVPAFGQCVGYTGPGGPCYTGPGGGAYTGPGGGAYTGPGGGAYTGPGGGAYTGPGGGAYTGPGGGGYTGPGGGAYTGPGGGAYTGPGGGAYAGPGGICSTGPGGSYNGSNRPSPYCK
jgi:hypothetical protein